MIHYTLLPQSEIKSLKREYHTRLFFTLCFFVSCAIIIGIISLLPAYILSYSQEKDLVEKVNILRTKREATGIDKITKELSETSRIIKILNDNKSKSDFSKIILDINKNLPAQVSLNSFQVNRQGEATTTSNEVIIQGKSLTRDALIALKKTLENNPEIKKVELPISDLAKSKDISFSIRLTIESK